VGRSNVGKSSLLNRLLGQPGLARVSRSPGRTRALNYFLVDSRFYLVDLPGYGYAKVGRGTRRSWARLVESYFADRGPGVVQLVDAGVGATDLDVQARSYLAGLGCPSVVVATKVDRLSNGRRAKGLEEIRAALGLENSDHLVPVSARTGEGVRELWRAIEALVASSALPSAAKGVRHE
jgi:GTP-binding protein